VHAHAHNFVYLFILLSGKLLCTWIWVFGMKIYYLQIKGNNNFKYVYIAFHILLRLFLDRPCSWCTNCSIISACNAYLPPIWTSDYIASICYASTRGSPFCAITCSSISCWTFSLNTSNGFPPTVAEPTGSEK